MKASGSQRRNQCSLVMVKLGSGTLPQAVAQPAGPPGRAERSVAVSGADSVSFQSLAGRSTSPSASRTTRPCCCAAMAMADGVSRAGRAA